MIGSWLIINGNLPENYYAMVLPSVVPVPGISGSDNCILGKVINKNEKFSSSTSKALSEVVIVKVASIVLVDVISILDNSSTPNCDLPGL